MRRPTASGLMSAASGSLWIPVPLVQWLFTLCVRCDKVVTRWHYRGCPCIAYEAKPGTPLGDFCARLTEEHGKDSRRRPVPEFYTAADGSAAGCSLCVVEGEVKGEPFRVCTERCGYDGETGIAFGDTNA